MPKQRKTETATGTEPGSETVSVVQSLLATLSHAWATDFLGAH